MPEWNSSARLELLATLCDESKLSFDDFVDIPAGMPSLALELEVAEERYVSVVKKRKLNAVNKEVNKIKKLENEKDNE